MVTPAIAVALHYWISLLISVDWRLGSTPLRLHWCTQLAASSVELWLFKDLGKQTVAGMGWERGVFQDGCYWFWYRQGNGTLCYRPGEGNGGGKTLWQLDGWDALGLAMFRSMCTLILRCTMVPWCTERLHAGEMSCFTILTMTCVVDVAASKPNPKPTRKWRGEAIPGTVWADFRKGECKTLVGPSKV